MKKLPNNIDETLKSIASSNSYVRSIMKIPISKHYFAIRLIAIENGRRSVKIIRNNIFKELVKKKYFCFSYKHIPGINNKTVYMFRITKKGIKKINEIRATMPQTRTNIDNDLRQQRTNFTRQQRNILNRFRIGE